MPKIFNAFIPIVLICLCTTTRSQAADLNVRISGIGDQHGTLIVELVDKDGYESGDSVAVRTQTLEPDSATEILELPDVEPGEYALLVFHDLNNNQELDFSVFSGPEEPLGLSNNIQFRLIPPGWQEVSFRVEKTDQDINIVLQH